MPQEEEIMAIKVSENGRLFTLQTKDSSYQMFADDKNVLLHLYYGEKIGEENLSGLIFCTDMDLQEIRRKQALTGNILLMHFRRKFREVVSVISAMI